MWLSRQRSAVAMFLRATIRRKDGKEHRYWPTASTISNGSPTYVTGKPGEDLYPLLREKDATHDPLRHV